MDKLKAVGKFFSVLILIGLLLVLLLLLIVELNKPFLINKAKTWYAENHSGELKINNFDYQIISSFPHLNLQINQVSIRDSSFASRNHRRLSAETIALSCSAPKLLFKKVEFNRFDLKGVFLDILVDTLDQASEEEKRVQTNAEHVPDLKKWFSKKGIKATVQDAQISMINRPRKNKYTGFVNELSGTFSVDGTVLSGPLHLDIDMDEMGLNVEKGTFFNQAHVVGDLEPKIDLYKKEFFAAPFDLKIDEQKFIVSVHFNLGADNFFDFELINEATDYQASKGLITKSIQEVIEPYELVRPFYTKTKIQGKFKKAGNTLISLDFKTKNNHCILRDTTNFDSLSFVGHSANRAVDDDVLESKRKKEFHLIFYELSSHYEEVPFSLKDSYIETTPATKNLIKLDLTAGGKTERLNEILKNDAFFFKTGEFELTSYFKGTVKNPLDVYTYATSSLKINKTNVFYNKANLTVPVRQFQFNTKNGNAILESMRLELPNQQRIDITGNLENYTSLIFDELDDPIKSLLKIECEALDYDALSSTIQAATEETQLEELTDGLDNNEKDLRAAFENIYERFNPELVIKVDQFSYKNLLIKDFQTFVKYLDKNTLIVSNSNFKFGEGGISIDGEIYLPQGNTTLAKLEIEADGAMTSLNELFGNKDFLLQDGRFLLTADYEGSLDSPSNLLTGSKVDLQIKDTKVYHKDQNLIILIDSALITVQKRDAEIVGLDIGFPQGNHLLISGQVNNFTSLLQDEAGYEVNSNVKISSTHLNSNNFNRVSEAFADVTQDKPKDKNAFHRGVTTIYRKFKPSLEIQVDTFTSRDYLLKKLYSKIYYQDSTNLIVEHTGFELGKGKLDLGAIFDFSDEEEIRTDLNLSANGESYRFNKLFNNNTFFFKEGIFDFKLNVTGNVLNKTQILESIDCRLTLDDCRVFYKDMNLTVPLDDVDLVIKNKDATINDFVIPLTSGHRIQATGGIENFYKILVDSIPDGVVSDLNIYSKELDFADLSRMFNVITEADSLSQDNIDTTAQITNVFKPTVQGIYDKFQPTVNLVIDDFSYKTFAAKNIKTGVYFQDRNHLELQKTEFELGEASVLLDAKLDLTERERTGFNTYFETKNLKLSKLIPAFDFFGLPSLKSAGGVSGIFAGHSNLNGHIIDKEGALDSTLMGTVCFDLEDLRLQNFAPVTSTAGKFLRDKRIEDIQFLRLKDTLTINDGIIKIPELNITSTAFTLYMKGDFRYDNKSNMLVSIPWSNFWFWDSETMPEYRTFGEAGPKFHIHALGNEENTMDYKIRFTQRKYYKAMGILDQYRSDKRRARRERKKYKREKRREKRRGD